jgi:hypothetical protein
MVHGAPQCWAWAFSLLFFLHLVLSIIALAFFLLKIFGSFGFFFHATQLCMGTFDD